MGVNVKTRLCTSLESCLELFLSAVERTELGFYGIDHNFLHIEEALTTFLRGSNKSKKNMEVYTNAMVEKQLMTNQTEI